MILCVLKWILHERSHFHPTIYVLSCGEKLSPKTTFVEKNDKYEVWVVAINWIIVYLPSSCCVPFHKFSCRWRSWRQRWQRWRRRRTRGSRNCRYAKIKMSDICLEKWYFDIISNEFILLQEHNNDLFNKLEEFEERYNNQLDVSRWHSFNLLESITNILDSIKNLQQKACNTICWILGPCRTSFKPAL